MSGGRAFFDTNVFVYVWAKQDERKASIAQALLTQAEQHGSGAISTQVIQEFFQVAFRLRPVKMPFDVAREALWLFFGSFYCVSLSPALIEQALALRERYQLAWYDSLIVAAAVEAKCSILYSEDFQNGQIFEGPLTVVNPFAENKN